MAGVQVEIPTKIERIAMLARPTMKYSPCWVSAARLLLPVSPANACPWLHKVNPQMNNAVVCFYG